RLGRDVRRHRNRRGRGHEPLRRAADRPPAVDPPRAAARRARAHRPADEGRIAPMTTITTTSVRDATFDVLRERGLTTLFANPGSTEIQLLSGLPEDLRFVLALHEASVVGLATGLALATGEPALAILHTTAGLGNAVAALATARVNRAPLVVIVGQQDRR